MTFDLPETDLSSEEGRVGQHPAEKQPRRSDLFNPYLCRTRNQVERFLNRIKHCRRVMTRYDRLAANYLAFRFSSQIEVQGRN